MEKDGFFNQHFENVYKILHFLVSNGSKILIWQNYSEMAERNDDDNVLMPSGGQNYPSDSSKESINPFYMGYRFPMV